MSQCEQILNYIKAHGSIEPMQALNQLGIYRLAGHNIKTTINNTAKHHYAVYTLEK